MMMKQASNCISVQSIPEMEGVAINVTILEHPRPCDELRAVVAILTKLRVEPFGGGGFSPNIHELGGGGKGGTKCGEVV